MSAYTALSKTFRALAAPVLLALVCAPGPACAQAMAIQAIEIEVADDRAWDSALLGLARGNLLGILPNVRFCLTSARVPPACSEVCQDSRSCAVRFRQPIPLDPDIRFAVDHVRNQLVSEPMARFVVPDATQCTARSCVIQSEPSQVTVRFALVATAPPAPARSPVASTPSPSDSVDRACPAQAPVDAATRRMDDVAVSALFAARALTAATGNDYVEYGGFLLDWNGTVMNPGAARGERGYIMARHKYCHLESEDHGRLEGNLGVSVPEYCQRGNYFMRKLESWFEVSSPISRYDVSWRIRGDRRIVASYHVHPRQARNPVANFEGEKFSRGDVETAIAQGIPEYLITPSCVVKVLMPHATLRTPLSPWFDDPCYVRQIAHRRSCD